MKTIEDGKKVFDGTEEEILQQVKDIFSQLREKAPKDSSRLLLKLFCRPVVLSYIISEIEDPVTDCPRPVLL